MVEATNFLTDIQGFLQEVVQASSSGAVEQAADVLGAGLRVRAVSLLARVGGILETGAQQQQQLDRSGVGNAGERRQQQQQQEGGGEPGGSGGGDARRSQKRAQPDMVSMNEVAEVRVWAAVVGGGCRDSALGGVVVAVGVLALRVGIRIR